MLKKAERGLSQFTDVAQWSRRIGTVPAVLKKVLLWATLFLFIADPASARINVVATLPWIGSLAEDIGGDKVNVKVLVKPTQDAHYVEAKPSMILAVRKADILMYNGLDLEIGYLPVLLQSARNRNIQPGQPGNFDCSRLADVIDASGKVDRSMGDVHPQGNPHYNFSPKNIEAVARGMAEQFSEMDGENKEFYQANLSVFRGKLSEKWSEWRKNGLSGKKFVAYHKFFEYLASEFDFSIVGYVEQKPGIPPAAAHVQKLVKIIRENNIQKILTTSYSNRRQVNFIAKKAGIETVVLPHDVGSQKGIGDWFDLMDNILDKLK